MSCNNDSSYYYLPISTQGVTDSAYMLSSSDDTRAIVTSATHLFYYLLADDDEHFTTRALPASPSNHSSLYDIQTSNSPRADKDVNDTNIEGPLLSQGTGASATVVNESVPTQPTPPPASNDIVQERREALPNARPFLTTFTTSAIMPSQLPRVPLPRASKAHGRKSAASRSTHPGTRIPRHILRTTFPTPPSSRP